MNNNYIIDAFNLGFKIPIIAQWISKGEIDRAIQLIINHINANLSTKAKKIIMVFDGKHGNPNQTWSHKKIQIKFSKKPQTADDIIRNFIRNQNNACDWIVVSSDNEIRNTARAMGAKIISSDDLASINREEKNHKKPMEQNEKYNPQTVDVDYWLKQFGESEEE